MFIRRLLALPVLAIAATGQPQIGANDTLGKFPGRDLKQIDGVPLASIVDYLKSKGLKNNGPFPEGSSFDLTRPKMLLDWDGNGLIRVLVTTYDEQFVPGASEGGMFVIRRDGHVTGLSHFVAGYRTELDSVSAGSSPQVGAIVQFRTRPNINGRRDVAGFDLAMVGSRPAIIRIYDVQGKPVRNIYCAPNMQLGPAPDLNQIAQEIYSSHPVQILEALTWLAGRHLAVGSERELDGTVIVHEPYADVAVFIRLWKDPKIRARLRELTRSTNTWICQAAEEALKTGGAPVDMSNLFSD